MKLDRNVNKDGRGKYALIQMRKVQELITQGSLPATHETVAYRQAKAVHAALVTLSDAGVICWGNETPGDQFFVVKYKDVFAAAALDGYADAIRAYIRRRPLNAEQQLIGSELGEFMRQIMTEAEKAKELGRKIPD